jgi:hypothetical protein
MRGPSIDSSLGLHSALQAIGRARESERMMQLCLLAAAGSMTAPPSIAATSSWVVVPSANLDAHGACGCAGGSCHDVPGFHYVGTMSTDAACAASCTAAAATRGNCSMWFRSSHSRHCWWKLGHDWDPKPFAGITAGCNKAVVPLCSTMPPPPPPPAPPPPPPPLPPPVPCTGSSAALAAPDCAAWQALWYATNGGGWLRGGTRGGRGLSAGGGAAGPSVLTDPCALSWANNGVFCSLAHGAMAHAIVAVVLPANNLSGAPGVSNLCDPF